MDISPLEKLGKVAGVPGIAIGAFVLVVGGVLAATDALPAGWRGPVIVLVVIGALLLGLLALAGWMRAARAGAQVARTRGDDSAARNEDASRTGGRQEAVTRGNNAPATNIRT
jgi:MFS family permease